ncbi:amidase [Candidatus Methylobacter oryzae]|uniref:Amidase n=1 Tax=Candidatus Methylobacter oryzae TaxID=2497749 RepID=A0ABY3CD88_9GAMM|nr:amidase [Candidatus Methylobacter oryzae]TRW97078.1 amidase [Candidatus Methylobacter oryzae]
MSAQTDMKPLSEYTATQLIDLLQAREVSAAEVTRSCLDSIAQHEDDIHAWVYLDPELALKQAEEADRKLASGQAGKLCGVPVGVKDIFNTTDMPTQMGSPIWKDFTPGNDARVVHYLRMADAVILGKTVTAEFAVHAPGLTCNPHHLDYIPGTSSSGSAAATAAHMVPLALGTQTAGSIIRPASYCGVYGFKPSFGLVPRTAMLKTTDSLDTVGMFARSVDDLALLFETIRVHGIDFPIAHEALNDPARRSIGNRSWRVGLLQGPKWDCAESYAQQALIQFGHRLSKVPGLEVEDIVLPASFQQAHEIHTTIYDRALAYYFKEEFVAQTLVSSIMYDIVQRGNQVSLEQYRQAVEAQTALAHELDDILSQRYDIIVDLSTGGEALKGLDSCDRPDNCLIWTLCGVPTMNLPVFTGPNELPFGAQIYSRRYNDYLLLAFARHLQAHGVIDNNTALPAFKA